MPGIVMDVSAMFVANIHLRVFCGAASKALLFFECSCAANIEVTRTWGDARSQYQLYGKTVEEQLTDGLSLGSCLAYSSIDFCRLSISSCPGRNIRTSPGGWSVWIWKNVRIAASV